MLIFVARRVLIEDIPGTWCFVQVVLWRKPALHVHLRAIVAEVIGKAEGLLNGSTVLRGSQPGGQVLFNALT